MSEQGNFVHCMLIPLEQRYLLLPNTVVAEVLPIPKLNQQSQSRIKISWREQDMPIVDLEQLLGQQSHTSSASKVCIVNALNRDSELTVYAFPCWGAPQLITVNEFALQPTHDETHSEYIHCQLKIGNKVAVIPQLDNIESYLKNLA